jgi:hypothetical protein
MAIKAETSFSLKDQLFNAQSVAALASAVKRAYPDFDKNAFERKTLAGFPERELKQRIEWLALVLGEALPQAHAQARKVLLKALPAPLAPDNTDDDFGAFIWTVPAEIIARDGCTKAHLRAPLEFLREATKRFSCASPIRAFRQQFPLETM